MKRKKSSAFLSRLEIEKIYLEVIRTTSPLLLDEFANHKNGSVRSAVARNIHTSIETLEKLANNDYDQVVDESLAVNPNLPTYLIEKIMDKYNIVSGYHSLITTELLFHPNISIKCIMKMPKHSMVREIVNWWLKRDKSKYDTLGDEEKQFITELLFSKD